VAKEGDATETKRVHKKAGAKSQEKGAARITEATRTAPTRTPALGEDDDSMTEVLGSTLVAGALGRKVGDARTVAMMKGITECRLELMSTRQKAKKPVPKAPDNSVESDSLAERTGASDERQSLSATDQHVQLKLPGDIVGEKCGTAQPSGTGKPGAGKTVIETGSAEQPRRITLTSVKTPCGERSLGEETVCLAGSGGGYGRWRGRGR